MATIGGPNTEKDNLVFGYDTGYGVADSDTSTRLYPGKPTANIVPDAYTMSGWGGYSNGNDGTFITEFGTTGYKVRNKNTWNGIAKGITLPSTGTYTISAWFRIWGKSSGNNGINVYTNGGGIGDTAQGGDDTRIGEWQRISMTRTYTTTSITFFIISWGGTSGTDWSSWDVTMPQIEKQSTQSPFLTGTRSSTQSLIDLKRTTDIDVSNVSFDSTGQPTFDGSNDQLVVDVDDIVRNASNVTIEGMVNATSISSAGPWAILTDHATVSDKDGFWWHYNIGNAVYFRVEDATAGEQGTTFSGAVPFVANTYQHIVTVVGDSNVKIYVNGVLSKSYTPNFKWNRIDSSKTAYLHIGRTYPNYYLSCAIPVFKMYNRELSVDEIKQNFNAYKNRFGI
jgi:hypothetical protein